MKVIRISEYSLKIRNGQTIRVDANNGSEAVKKVVKAHGCAPDDISVVDVREVTIHRAVPGKSR